MKIVHNLWYVQRGLSIANQFLSTFGARKLKHSHTNSLSSALIKSRVTLVLIWPGHENWENSHTNSRLLTLMQLLFSFDQHMRIEKTLIQTLACWLSCNFCSRLTRTRELRKLSYNLSLVNSHATLVVVWLGP